MSKILKKNKRQLHRSHMNEHNQMEAMDTIIVDAGMGQFVYKNKRRMRQVINAAWWVYLTEIENGEKSYGCIKD